MANKKVEEKKDELKDQTGEQSEGKTDAGAVGGASGLDGAENSEGSNNGEGGDNGGEPSEAKPEVKAPSANDMKQAILTATDTNLDESDETETITVSKIGWDLLKIVAAAIAATSMRGLPTATKLQNALKKRTEIYKTVQVIDGLWSPTNKQNDEIFEIGKEIKRLEGVLKKEKAAAKAKAKGADKKPENEPEQK